MSQSSMGNISWYRTWLLSLKCQNEPSEAAAQCLSVDETFSYHEGKLVTQVNCIMALPHLHSAQTSHLPPCNPMSLFLITTRASHSTWHLYPQTHIRISYQQAFQDVLPAGQRCNCTRFPRSWAIHHWADTSKLASVAGCLLKSKAWESIPVWVRSQEETAWPIHTTDSAIFRAWKGHLRLSHL